MAQTFEQLTQALEQAGSDTTPAELHGFLCGHLCTGQRDHHSWLKHAQAMLDVGLLSEDFKGLLLILFEENEPLIHAADFDFQLILPEEDDDISLRVMSVGLWCEGFLTSFGMGCTDEQVQKLSDDSKTALSDLVAIAQISDEGVDDSDATENDYMEIVEYVRMAVLSLSMECRQPPTVATSPAVH